MSKVSIKNIGPIKTIDLTLNKINVIIGPQSSGKSVIAKIVSFCQWAEKRFILDGNKFNYSFKEMFLDFHRIGESYFSSKSSFKYEGDFATIIQKGTTFEINIKAKAARKNFRKTKNIYIPAERNFVSVIPNLGRYNETNDNIMNLLYDWYEAKRNYSEKNKLDILDLGISYHYSQDADADILTLKNKKQLHLRESSSGLQSVVPLLMLIDYLTDKFYKISRSSSVHERDVLVEEFLNMINEKNIENLTEKGQTKGTEINFEEFLTAIRNRKDYSSTNFVIEEPEQNLFPSTQKHLIYFLFKKLSSNRRNHKALITTHSPFILYAINNCLMGKRVSENMPIDEQVELQSYSSWTDPKTTSIWEIRDGLAISIIDERTGTVSKHYFNDVMNEIQNEYYEMLSYFKQND